MRVLLVEDDTMIGQAVKTALQDAAYAVDWVTDGEMASSFVLRQSYDLMLLDLGLSRKDGIAVLREIRASGILVPVLILTARDDIGDRIRGLDAGADDYLVKPFDVNEMLARMRALIRRSAGVASPQLSNGELTLDVAAKQVRVGDSGWIALTAREFALLEALLIRPGAILSRRDLEDRIYGCDEEVASNAVEVLIYGVRKKLGASSIKNVRGLGWMVDPVL